MKVKLAQEGEGGGEDSRQGSRELKPDAKAHCLEEYIKGLMMVALIMMIKGKARTHKTPHLQVY